MKLDEIYLKAAHVIRTNGHHKFDFCSYPGSLVGITPRPEEWPVCAAGALSIAMFDDPYPPSEGQDGRTEFDAVVARLNARITDLHLYGFGCETPVARLGGWNDADERTDADVIALFEQTAREVA